MFLGDHSNHHNDYAKYDLTSLRLEVANLSSVSNAAFGNRRKILSLRSEVNTLKGPIPSVLVFLFTM